MNVAGGSSLIDLEFGTLLLDRCPGHRQRGYGRRGQGYRYVNMRLRQSGDRLPIEARWQARRSAESIHPGRFQPTALQPDRVKSVVGYGHILTRMRTEPWKEIGLFEPVDDNFTKYESS